MKKIFITFCLLMGIGTGYCQEVTPQRVSFSVLGVFQAFKVPLASPDTYFRNKGLSVAALYNFSEKSAYQQSFELGYYFNRYHGSTFMLSTSTHFNPIHSRSVIAGISLGAGYMNSGFSHGGWEQNEQGEWINASNRKGNFYIPADLHIRIKVYENERIILSPVLTYQLNALINYSHAATILPQSMIKAGLNFSLN